MALRTAIRGNALVTFGVLLVGLWTILTALEVIDAWQALGDGGVAIVTAGRAVGQTWVSGVVGLLVLAVFLGLLVVLYSEVSEVDPAPETFPPER